MPAITRMTGRSAALPQKGQIPAVIPGSRKSGGQYTGRPNRTNPIYNSLRKRQLARQARPLVKALQGALTTTQARPVARSLQDLLAMNTRSR